MLYHEKCLALFCHTEDLVHKAFHQHWLPYGPTKQHAKHLVGHWALGDGAAKYTH